MSHKTFVFCNRKNTSVAAYETLKENRHLFEVEINESTLTQMETIKQSIRN